MCTPEEGDPSRLYRSGEHECLSVGKDGGV